MMTRVPGARKNSIRARPSEALRVLQGSAFKLSFLYLNLEVNGYV